MMKYSVITVLISGLILGGCSSTSKTSPDWINAKSKDYPSSRYLIGRGEANRQPRARDRARADLAKIFRSPLPNKVGILLNIPAGA